MTDPLNTPLRLTRGILGLVVLGSSIALLGCREPGKSGPAEATSQPAAPTRTQAIAAARPQPTFEVRRETLRDYTPAVGSFRARQTSRLGPQVSGRVDEVLVEVGDLVAAGQILVRLDPSFFRLEVEQTEAAVAAARSSVDSAKVDVADAQRELRRQLDLFSGGVGSTKERDDAQAAYDRAVIVVAERQARLLEAEKRLAYSRERLAETDIRAPYDAAVTARLVDPGEPAGTAPPTHLLEIQEVGVLYLEFSLPQEMLAGVREGTRLEFDVEGVDGGADSAVIATLFPAIDEATRAFRCRAIVPNPEGRYQPGLLARVRVVAQEVADALVVPRAALAPTTDGWRATVIIDGRPVVQDVTVGLQTDDWVQILAGLSEGDHVLAPDDDRS